MKKDKNKILTKITISAILGIILILFWINLIDINEVMVYISSIKIIYITPAIIFYLLSYLIRSERLRKLLSPKQKIHFFRNYSYVLAGNFVNYLIPIRAGELAKSYLYKQNHSLRMSDTLPAIFIDKIFDTFVIMAVLLLIPFIAIVHSNELNILIFLLIFVFLIGISILYFSQYRVVSTILNKLLILFPKRYNEKISDFIGRFLSGIGILKYHKNLLFPCISLTFLATITDSLFFFMMMKAFSVDIHYLQVLFGYTLIFLSYILPHPPAQIGSNELIMILIFTTGFGFDKNLVSAVMTLSHFITAVVILITGTLSLGFAGAKIFDIIHTRENKL